MSFSRKIGELLAEAESASSPLTGSLNQRALQLKWLFTKYGKVLSAYESLKYNYWLTVGQLQDSGTARFLLGDGHRAKRKHKHKQSLTRERMHKTKNKADSSESKLPMDAILETAAMDAVSLPILESNIERATKKLKSAYRKLKVKYWNLFNTLTKSSAAMCASALQSPTPTSTPPLSHSVAPLRNGSQSPSAMLAPFGETHSGKALADNFGSDVTLDPWPYYFGYSQTM